MTAGWAAAMALTVITVLSAWLSVVAAHVGRRAARISCRGSETVLHAAQLQLRLASIPLAPGRERLTGGRRCVSCGTDEGPLVASWSGSQSGLLYCLDGRACVARRACGAS